LSFLLRISLSASFVALVAACGSYAQQANDSTNVATLNDTKPSAGTAVADTKFVKEAAEGDTAEVALGQLAVEKASSSDVKNSGQHWWMITVKPATSLNN